MHKVRTLYAYTEHGQTIIILAAEISSLSQDAMLSDAAKYFKMKKQAVIANNLMEYVSSTSQPLSILLGNNIIHYLLLYTLHT